jgi:hypothetical protein
MTDVYRNFIKSEYFKTTLIMQPTITQISARLLSMQPTHNINDRVGICQDKATKNSLPATAIYARHVTMSGAKQEGFRFGAMRRELECHDTRKQISNE